MITTVEIVYLESSCMIVWLCCMTLNCRWC